MMGWIILGHCYILGGEYGNITKLFKKTALDSFLGYIVISSDFAISFLFFMSGFIGMFALIKKFKKSNENALSLNARDARDSVQTENSSISTFNVPKLSKKALLR